MLHVEVEIHKETLGDLRSGQARSREATHHEVGLWLVGGDAGNPRQPFVESIAVRANPDATFSEGATIARREAKERLGESIDVPDVELGANGVRKTRVAGQEVAEAQASDSERLAEALDNRKIRDFAAPRRRILKIRGQ